jgi:hypothetical protein
MDEDDNDDRRGSASEDGGHPEEGLGQAGTMLARRLAAATRTLSRIDERLRAEEDALSEELIEGRLEETLLDKLPDFVGSEHEVWSDGTSVVKATLPGVFGRRWGARRFGIPSEYLERVKVVRAVFSFDWRIVGIAAEAGKPRIVSRQPYFKGEPPTLDEIDSLLRSLGFEFRSHRFGDHWYRSRDKVLVFDAEPGNFVKTAEGLVPVDLIVQREEAESLG